MSEPWDQIEAEARGAFHGAGKFPLRAYSEAMPPPYVGFKPYAPERARNCSTFGCSSGHALDIDEYEQAFDLEPGMDRIGKHLVDELAKLVHGQPHALSKTLLDGNAAWPAELAAAAKHGKLAHDRLIVICSLALSRTQDDKGNERWTLFGGSHDGPARAFWHDMDEAALAKLLAWAGIKGEWRVYGPHVPDALRTHALGDALPHVLVTFEPFAKLPQPVRDAYIAGKLALVPTPASLVFFEHPQYKKLAEHMPRAMQVPLLHLFPRVESAYAIRIPQSGWLDEHDPATSGHKVVGEVVRTHRWQRVERDEGIAGDGAYTDKVSVALFSTEPAAVDLYDKPIARNSQIWNERYELVLDGWPADRAAARARRGDRRSRRSVRLSHVLPADARGRSRAVLARARRRECEGTLRGRAARLHRRRARRRSPSSCSCRTCSRARDTSRPRASSRRTKDARATRARTTRASCSRRASCSARRWLRRTRARSCTARSTTRCEQWLAALPKSATHHDAGERLADALSTCIGEEPAPPVPHVLGELGTRAFEEQIWTTIAHLAHGEFKQKNDSDGITVNKGKHGGPAAKAAHVVTHERRDLEALGDHLHARYREMIAKHGVGEVVDHVFKWETDFDFPWMEGWAKNQKEPAERNIVMMIPGKNRSQAVVMGDHYDTAYMEDVYYAESGGDLLRAPACGADDNHSATTALLLAAERLLPLAKAGKLERDVWLIHLTGEEFPPDCMGARALCQGLVERSLQFTAEDGSKRDVSHVRSGRRVRARHGRPQRRPRPRRVPDRARRGRRLGEARAARTSREPRVEPARRRMEPRPRGLGRAKRMPDDPKHPVPPPFAHLPLHGDIRVEWEPRSALYNTDGQVFSDIGIPVVLFMENYDISRKGYHDTHDTMANIDLDYCAAVTAIAIETVADCACAPSL